MAVARRTLAYAQAGSWNPRTLWCVASLVVAWALLGSSISAQTTFESTGHWTDTTAAGVDWGHTQIHMALLRGDPNWQPGGPYHSYILSPDPRVSPRNRCETVLCIVREGE